MKSRNWAGAYLSLIALVCLVAFALPDPASAKSPTAQTQIVQDYTIASTADNAGYQHTDAVTNGAEVETDVGARVSTRRHNPILMTPMRGYAFAYGCAGTNEQLTSTATSKNTLQAKYGDAGRHLRRLSRS